MEEKPNVLYLKRNVQPGRRHLPLAITCRKDLFYHPQIMTYRFQMMIYHFQIMTYHFRMMA
ncbi:MAG: hypothetical protein GY950_04770, partial [bacterium]|nr:hypothetical protein [bacterium]